MERTVVLGASPKPHRFSYKAVVELNLHNIPVTAIGYREGNILDIPILKGKPHIDDVDTVALYLGPERQVDYYDYIISLNPRRIIFNPGTENPDYEVIAEKAGIKLIKACMLLMLQTDSYQNHIDD